MSWNPRDDALVQATLRVQCTYEFVGAARMKISLQRHAVNVDARNEAAKNIPPEAFNSMVHAVQKALPAEIFDPSGLVDYTFVAPDCFITRLMGKSRASVRNVFVPADAPHSFPARK